MRALTTVPISFFSGKPPISNPNLFLRKRMNLSAAAGKSSSQTSDYDRFKELQAFDETKTGVKGLVDAGIASVPKIFIRPSDELALEESNCNQNNLDVPVIDLGGISDKNKHEEIVDQVRSASKTWGFFQVVNHGIPLNVLEGMIEGVHRFNQQDLQVKKEWYTRDLKRKVTFHSNFDLYQSRTANWRDSLSFNVSASNPLDPQDLPAACRESTTEYVEHVRKLGDTLFEILSEALGLKSDYFEAMGCAGKCTFVCHYYPQSPEPKLTMGASSHSDPAFLTILLQDQIGGLQVLHDNQWVDVRPIAGGLVVNMGDVLQIVSNDKFKSVDHRVVSKSVGPRVSVACFFTGTGTDALPPKSYGPIKELISEENPPRFRSFLMSEYLGKYFARGLDGKSALDSFKL